MGSNRIFYWSLTAALGGFLFGFDTAVISGAERAVQALWSLDDWWQGFTVSAALIGTFFGALAGGRLGDGLGRKKSLILIGLLYTLSALGSALTASWAWFVVFRFVGGLGVGASSVVGPTYITEIAPTDKRGRMAALFQFNIVLGILMAFVSNYLLLDFGDEPWRWMLGVEAVPAVAFLALVLTVPESPRWLAAVKGDAEAAAAILRKIGHANPEAELAQFQTADAAHSNTGDGLFSGNYRFSIVLAVTIAVFNQVTGINAIIYYSPRIFALAGLTANAGFLATIGVGLVNFVATLVGIRFIDRAGRKRLMVIGSYGLIATLGLVAWCFYMESGGLLVPILLFSYIAFFALSQGAVIWVFLAEIFPNHIRASGQGIGSSTHWFMAAVISFVFPGLTAAVGPGNTFLFFAVCMVAQLIWVLRVMPETKGVSLEDLQKQLRR